MKWLNELALTTLIAELRNIQGLRERGDLIASAGIPENTWLAHCLMYRESEREIREAWAAEQS